MTAPSRSVVLALLLGFLFGVGSGWLSFPLFRHRRSPEQRFQHLLKRFDSDLKLDGEQHAKVEAILKSERDQIEAMHADIEPKFKKIHGATVDEIRKVLRPDQQPRLDKMEERFEERRKNRPWGPPR